MPKISYEAFIGSEPLIIFERRTDEGEEQEWTGIYSGPFDLTNPLNGMMAEAKARGMHVFVSAFLIPPLELEPGEELEDTGVEADTET